MKIYVAHAKASDFQGELYGPIKASKLYVENSFVFPLDGTEGVFNSKGFFKNDCELVIAEVSYPATGMGIELGWADLMNIPIVCIYKKGSKVANSLKMVTQDFYEYNNVIEMVAIIGEVIQKVKNPKP